MIYLTITLSSLISVVLHRLYALKKKIHFSKHWFVLELCLFWIMEFGIFNILTWMMNGNWPLVTLIKYKYVVWFSQDDVLITIGISVLIGVLLTIIAILFHLYVNSIKKDKYETKCLFTIRGIQVFPLTSVIYYIAGIVVVAAGLLIAEGISTNKNWQIDNYIIDIMNEEKIVNDMSYPLVKIKGTELDADADVKILVVGDSFVWGEGSSNLNWLWWNQLSLELKRRGYSCNVYAAGYKGASTYEQLQWLSTTSMVSDLDPDIIIIGYVTNDPDLNYLGQNTTYQYGRLMQAVDMPFESVLMKVLPGTYPIFDLKLSEKLGPLGLLSEKIGYQYSTWELKIIEKEKLNKYNTLAVKPLGDFAKSIDIPVVLVTTPQIPDVQYFEPRYAPVLPLFEQAGIKAYNLINDFQETCSADLYRKNYSINPINIHPGTASTWFYSKYVANMLESEYPNVLGVKTLTGKEAYKISVNDWTPYSLNPRTISETETSASYIITYPAASSRLSFLTMPANEYYVKLNFQYPVDISTVKIERQKPGTVTLYVTAINDTLGFDDQTMFNLGEKSSQASEWSDDSTRRVTSLCIHSDNINETEDLTVTITCKEGEVYP